MNAWISRWVVSSYCMLFLIACGAGTTESNRLSSVDEGGIGGTGISYGSISSFGSVFVNGVKFDTRNASVVVEGIERGVGDQAVLNNLALGQVVRVEGIIDQGGSTGTAAWVVFNDSIEGPIESISVESDIARLTVLGQPVLLDERTRLDSVALADLEVDNVVEISGLVDHGGIIRATYLSKKAEVLVPGTEVELQGVVHTVDISARTFMVNALIIDYSSASLSGFIGAPSAGQLVEVKGILDSNGVLIALTVEANDELGSEDADQVEIEGFVTHIISSSMFNLGNQTINITGMTRFEGGMASDLALGTRLEVEGYLLAGTVFAVEISFADNVVLESDAATVDHAAGTLTLLNLPGVVVATDSLTEISGGISSFSDLQPGYHVKIIGRTSASGEVIALELDGADSSDPKVIVQGPVDSRSDPDIVILDVTIDTSGVPDGAFAGVDEAPTKRDGFFGSVIPGNIVRASGEVAFNAGVDWEEIVLEDDD